jgi:hypothetical protein
VAGRFQRIGVLRHTMNSQPFLGFEFGD